MRIKNLFKNRLFYLNVALILLLGGMIVAPRIGAGRLQAFIKQVFAAVGDTIQSDGSGTVGTIARATGNNQIGNSIMSESGSGSTAAITVAGNLTANNLITAGTGNVITTQINTNNIQGNGNDIGIQAGTRAGTHIYLTAPIVAVNGDFWVTGSTHSIYNATQMGLKSEGRIDLTAPIVSVNGTFFATNFATIAGRGGNNGIGLDTANRIDLSAPTVSVNGTLFKTAGAFLIDHPLDPQNKYLQHSFVESPDMRDTYYGQAATVNGTVTIALPDWWMALNGSNQAEYNYQFTPIGKWCQLYVAREIEHNVFMVASVNGDCKFSWTVAGVRHDAYAQAHRIQIEGLKGDGNSFTPATYFHPELFGAGK